MKQIFVLVSAAVCLSGCSVTPPTGGMTAAPAIQPSFSSEQHFVPPLKPDTQLQKQISEIAKDANGRVGVYATVIETGQSVSLNANEHFAMQSVVKVPIAMAVLKRAEEGLLDLDEKVGVTKDDFVPGMMRSPIRDQNPNGSEITIRELIQSSISESDGTASDVLQRLAGDAGGVNDYVDSLGINGMHIERTHKDFGIDWSKQYDNWATPAAVVEMLSKLYRTAGISGGNRELLLKFMTESNNPHNRLKGMLPEGTVVAHKTGTGSNRNGLAAATHDVGIITLPNGNHIAIAVFVGDSTADTYTRRAVIAKIARAAFDKWSGYTEPVKTANFNERHALN